MQPRPIYNKRQSRTTRDRLWSRKEIGKLISQGRSIVIFDGRVLKADAWLPFHPGGEKAIRHMIGRDATDEINALHSLEARMRMRSYQIGHVNLPWINFTPPIQGGDFSSFDEAEAECATGILSAGSSQDNSGSSSPSTAPVDSPRTIDDEDEFRRISSASSVTSHESIFTDSSAIEKQTQRELQHDLSKYPSLDRKTQDIIVDEYRRLNEQIKKRGLYQCSYSAYAWEVGRYSCLFTLSLACLAKGWYATSGLFLGLFWHQLVFTAHDAGHMGITHNFTIDSLIGFIIADFLGGLSLGWWKRNHNVHHIVTNSPEHDPDIEHMPIFAVSHRFFSSLRSTFYDRLMAYDSFAKSMIRYQHFLYYPLLAFGRFNLYRLSWEHLLFGLGPRKGPAWWHRWFEIAGQVFFWSWFGYAIIYRTIPTNWDRFVFVMVSHMVTMPLHVQITLSHFAMSTSDLGVHESFPQKMLRTTMDVDCPPWLDFIHGGLQFQAIHHLYPRIPRHNLRETQALVQDFCNRMGIPYALYGFVRGNKEVVGKLREVGQQAAILAECQRVVAERALKEL